MTELSKINNATVESNDSCIQPARPNGLLSINLVC